MVVVVVAVESMKKVVWVCESPKDTSGKGAIVIGVETVDVGEDMENSWNRPSLIGTEVGISNLSSGFVVTGSETCGCDVVEASSSL